MNLENLFVQYKVMLFRKQIERLNKSGTFDFISTNVIFFYCSHGCSSHGNGCDLRGRAWHEYELQYEVVT